MTFVLKFATFILLCGSISTIALSQDTMNKSVDLSSTATFNAGENTSLRERGQITFEKMSQVETIQQRLSNKSSSSFTLYNKVQKERKSLCHLSNSYKISFSSRHEYGDYQYNICIDDQKSFEYLQEKNDINYVMSYIINTLEKDFHNLIGTDEYSHLVDFLKSKGTNVESFSDNYAITNFIEKWKQFFYHPPENYYTDSIIVELTDLCNNLDADINKNDTRPSLCSIEIDKSIWNTTDFQNYQNELFGALHYWKEHPENFLKVLEKMNHRQRQNLFSLLEGLKGEKIIHTFQALKKEINEYLLTKVSSLDASFKTLYPKKMMDYKIQLPVAENLHSRFLTIFSEDPTTNDGKNKDDDNLLRERVETEEEESKGDLDKIRPDVLIGLFSISGPHLKYELSFDSVNNLNFSSEANKEKIKSNKCSKKLINDIKKQFTSTFKNSNSKKGKLKSYYKVTLNKEVRYLPLTSSRVKTLKKFPTRAMTLNKELKYLCKK